MHYGNEEQEDAERSKANGRTRPKQRRRPSSLSRQPLGAAYADNSRSSTPPIDRRGRPHRWREAVDKLIALQAEYANWLAILPDSLRDTPTSEAVETIVDLDVTTLVDTPLPRGDGRD